MEFEWDLSKEITNLQKHGISFTEAAESFADPQGFQLMNIEHSAAEPRFYWVGKSRSGRVLTTWFTRRRRVIRIIWFGPMEEVQEVIR